MDLYAFKQIDDLSFILTELNIDVPRLRGLRLMEAEEKISQEVIDNIIRNTQIKNAIQWLQQKTWDSWYSDNAEIDHPAFIYEYNKENKRNEIIDIDFSKVDAEDAEIIKKKNAEDKVIIMTDFELYNKYVGQKVLYIHTRLGDYNREGYQEEIAALQAHKNYLADVDDSYDSTYASFYFDISEIDDIKILD